MFGNHPKNGPTIPTFPQATELNEVKSLNNSNIFINAKSWLRRYKDGGRLGSQETKEFGLSLNN